MTRPVWLEQFQKADRFGALRPEELELLDEIGWPKNEQELSRLLQEDMFFKEQVRKRKRAAFV